VGSGVRVGFGVASEVDSSVGSGVEVGSVFGLVLPSLDEKENGINVG
jgi:hypothetical protein